MCVKIQTPVIQPQRQLQYQIINCTTPKQL